MTLPYLPDLYSREIPSEFAFVPLTEEEKREGPASWRFFNRVTSAALCDNPKLRELADIVEKKYVRGGRWSDFGYFVKDEFDASQVWALMDSVLHSRIANHHQKYSVAALGLLFWFKKATKEELEEFLYLKNS